jgi:hypothetical protein
MAFYSTGLAIVVQESDDESETVEGPSPSPFTSYVLRCQDVPLNDQLILWWHSPTEPIPISIERELIDILVPYQRRERGMFYKQSYHRKRELRRICRVKQINIRMALSLRRHHMRRLNPHLTLEQLHLGTEDVIRESARLFEVSVEEFLLRHHVAFYSEQDQRAYINEHRPQGQPFPPTPDFILKQKIRIRKYKTPRGNKREIIEELSVSCK